MKNGAASVPRGALIWLTGLSGAGKTTVGKIIHARLQQNDLPCVFLDGDAVREVLGNDLGHSPEDRLKNAFRLARLAHLLCSQGIVVVCATMSLFPEIWQWNREQHAHYFEIYLKADKEVLLKRDPKGVYAGRFPGSPGNVVGVDIPLVEPTAPFLVLGPSELGAGPEDLASLILSKVGTSGGG